MEAPSLLAPPLDKPSEPPDQTDSPLPTGLINGVPGVDKLKSMEVEAISHTPPGSLKKSFRDIVNSVQHCFLAVTSVVDQLQEALEEEIAVSDTPLKVSFSPDQLRVLWAPWSRTLMGKVLTVGYFKSFSMVPFGMVPLGLSYPLWCLLAWCLLVFLILCGAF